MQGNLWLHISFLAICIISVNYAVGDEPFPDFSGILQEEWRQEINDEFVNQHEKFEVQAIEGAPSAMELLSHDNLFSFGTDPDIDKTRFWQQRAWDTRSTVNPNLYPRLPQNSLPMSPQAVMPIVPSTVPYGYPVPRPQINSQQRYIAQLNYAAQHGGSFGNLYARLPIPSWGWCAEKPSARGNIVGFCGKVGLSASDQSYDGDPAKS